MTEWTVDQTISFLSSLKGNFEGPSIICKNIKINPEEIGGDYWVIKNTAGTPRSGSSGFNLNGYGYSCNGANSAILQRYNEVAQYNDTLDLWTIKNPCATSRSGGSCMSLNGFGYHCNGNTPTIVNEVFQYNDNLNLWNIKSPGGTARSELTSFITNAYGYICNGNTGSASCEVNQYNDAIDIFTFKGQGGTARYALAGFSLNNFGYISGGYTGSTALPETNKYIEHLNVMSYVRNGLNETQRYGVSGFNLNGFGYVSGGNNGSPSPNTEKYIDVVDIWTRVSDMPTGRQYFTTFTVNGCSYIANGDNGGTLNTTYQYRNHNYYYIDKTFKISSKPPKHIIVATNFGDVFTTLPIQLSTSTQANSASWMYMESNKDSLLKFDQTITQTISSTPMSGSALYNYQIRVGIPSFAHSISANTLGLSGQYFGDYFVNSSALPVAISAGNGIQINGYGYMMDGSTTTTLATNSVYEYNDSLNIWNTITFSGSQTARYLGANCSLNGFGYLFCGINGSNAAMSEVNQYDNFLRSFTQKAWAPNSLNAPVSLALNGYAYLLFGQSMAEAYYSTVYRYSDSLNLWNTLATIGDTRSRAGGFSAGDKGYIYSGWRNTVTTVLSTQYEYNDAVQTSLAKASLPTTVYGSRAFSLENGGYASNGGTAFAQAELVTHYCYLCNIWRYRTNKLQRTSHSGDMTINNYGYFCSGAKPLFSYTFDAGVSKYYSNIKKFDLNVTLYVEE